MKFTKSYTNGVTFEQVLDVEVTKTSTSAILTDWDEYSTMTYVHLTKRDALNILNMPDEQAILYVIRLIQKNKVKSNRIAHKTGRYWEDDLPR